MNQNTCMPQCLNDHGVINSVVERISLRTACFKISMTTSHIFRFCTKNKLVNDLSSQTKIGNGQLTAAETIVSS